MGTEDFPEQVQEGRIPLIAEMTLVDHESFYKYFHMTPQRFSQLLSCVGPFIKRQNTRLREAIPPDERLALTLH